MINREFLQLAHTFDNDFVGGWYASEKLDGMRALWDGGITRGMYADTVPFANTAKDARLVQRPMATGLWSRYGKVIHAPDWWLDGLPTGQPLDGELYLGPGQFQEVMSIVKQHTPDVRWRGIKFAIFDAPSYSYLFRPGKINNPNFQKEIISDVYHWVSQIVGGLTDSVTRFYEVAEKFGNFTNEVAFFLHQERLPTTPDLALERIDELMVEVTAKGGEGLILRKPESIWTPKRTRDLLKIKPSLDSEATVMGYVWGKGKLDGLMGVLVVLWQNKTFELSGFTDDERLMYDTQTGSQAGGFPGDKVPDHITNRRFPRGSQVTFKYRELTDGGLPKEARYFRKPV